MNTTYQVMRMRELQCKFLGWLNTIEIEDAIDYLESEGHENAQEIMKMDYTEMGAYLFEWVVYSLE